MAPRSSWKGYLKVSLVSVPVKAYTGNSSSSGTVSLNQLHDKCNSRIKYKKVCPQHGEIAQNEIVSGYEFSKDQYVIIDTAELEKLRTENDKSINVSSFVPSETIDPSYLTGKTYYLVPDGPVGQKPYQLIVDAIENEGLNAIASIVLSNKEQVVRLRVADGLLVMDVLAYKSQVKDPGAFRDEVVDSALSEDEKKLTRQLVSALAKEEFDPSEYKDVYTERLAQLIEAKVQGEELVTPPAEDEPQIVNLMEALKQSVESAGGTTATAAKPKRRKSASAKKAKPKKAAAKKTTRKKKSG